MSPFPTPATFLLKSLAGLELFFFFWLKRVVFLLFSEAFSIAAPQLAFLI